jgi:hypothetical protein
MRSNATLTKSALSLGHLLVLVLASPICAADQPGQSADRLLRLVPPDVAVVVTVEGLRDQVRLFNSSHLAGEMTQVPAVKSWLEAERFKQFDRSRAQIEAFLGSSITEIRDEIFGDAVLLAIRLPADGPAEPGQASGLILLQARDQNLLKRVVRVINTAQQESGELARIGAIERNGTTYHVREFPEGTNRPPEWYVSYADGTFALSNSEALIQAVIDRKPRPAAASAAAEAGTTQPAKSEQPPVIDSGLDRLPKLQAVKRRLPERALARVFVDPRPIARLIAASARPRNSSEGNLLAMLERYFAAVDYAGAALVSGERSLKLHTVETVDPSRLDAWIMRWAGDTRPVGARSDHTPPTAIAKVAMHLDAAAIMDGIRMIIPEEDQPKLANLETILSGVLLGQDFKSRILPALGPTAIAYIDVPADFLKRATNPPSKPAGSAPMPAVLLIGIQAKGGSLPAPSEHRQDPPAADGRGATVVDALDNALRTLLALLALDQERAHGRAKITTRTIGGVPIHTLDCPAPFAYAIDRNSRRLILGTSADAIAGYLKHAAGDQAGDRFGEYQAAAFANTQTFACIDLEAINRLASRHRDPLIQSLTARQGRPAAEVDRDLAQIQGLAKLFDAVFITSRIDSQAAAIERSLGVILHSPPAQPAASP